MGGVQIPVSDKDVAQIYESRIKLFLITDGCNYMTSAFNLTYRCPFNHVSEQGKTVSSGTSCVSYRCAQGPNERDTLYFVPAAFPAAVNVTSVMWGVC